MLASCFRPCLSSFVRALPRGGRAGGVRPMAASPSLLAFFSSHTLPEDKILPFVVKSDRVQVRWTSDEDQRLRDGVKEFGPLWTKISEALLPYKSPDACRHRWTEVLDPKIKNGTWTAAEDARLKKLVGEIGVGKWAEIAKHLDGRTKTACRMRWTQRADPSLKHGPWSEEEDRFLLEGYAAHPNKWVSISDRLPGRSCNSIRRRYQSLSKPEPDHIFWTTAEDQLLKDAVAKHSARDWAKIAEYVPGRSSLQCKQRWSLTMAQHGETKDSWSKEDDALLRKGVDELGTDGKWAAIAEGIPGKSGKECKSRWERDLSRILNTAPRSAEEDATIKRMREEGKTWNKIIHQLPCRGKNAILQRCMALGCGIQDRVRWTNEQIEALRVALLRYEGKKPNWNKIAQEVSGKTVQQCKSRDFYNRSRV